MNKHLLNAETQVASELLALVQRFVKSRKRSRRLSSVVMKKAEELYTVSCQVHPAVIEPVEPLGTPSERKPLGEAKQLSLEPVSSEAKLYSFQGKADRVADKNAECPYQTTSFASTEWWKGFNYMDEIFKGHSAQWEEGYKEGLYGADAKCPYMQYTDQRLDWYKGYSCGKADAIKDS